MVLLMASGPSSGIVIVSGNAAKNGVPGCGEVRSAMLTVPFVKNALLGWLTRRINHVALMDYISRDGWDSRLSERVLLQPLSRRELASAD